MHYMNLQFDENARQLIESVICELENDDGWFKMTTRIAAQVDSVLKEKGYRGTVIWFSDSDLIEHQIEY
ncbi:hypothetical protein [Vibrio comitans]